MKKYVRILLSAVLALLFCASCTSIKSPGRTVQDYRIALIAMDSVDQHWVFMNEGAQRAAREIGCTVTFMAPPVMDDALSIEQINNAVAAGYDAILFAPSSADAAVLALREAEEAGVKIIYVDSAAHYPAQATYSTDNFEGGKRAGECMLQALTEAGITSGNIGVVSVRKSLITVEQRAAGFIEALADSDFNVLEVQYSDGDPAKAQAVAENYITQGVVGIFGANEGSSVGAGNAIRASEHPPIGIGFDTSDALLSLLRDGHFKAIITQNPDVMGYEGVRAAVAAIGGEDLGGRDVDTGVNVVYAEE